MAKSRFIQDFGLLVREAREAAGLTQEELAAMAGFHRTAISLIETAARSSTLDTVERLARALKVEPCDLMPPLLRRHR